MRRIAANVTRSDARLSGGSARRPILAAMKLSAQITMTRPTAEAKRKGRGRRSTAIDGTEARLEAYPRCGGHFYRAVSGRYDLGFDDVLVPVALAGGYVAGKGEIGQR